MARIPHEHHAEILARAARGETSDGIAAWLGGLAPPIEVSGRAVRRLLSKTRDFRGDAVKAQVREKLAPIVTSDLEELEAARQRARAIEDLAMRGRIVTVAGEPLLDKKTKEPVREPDLELALKAIKEEAAILDKKLHYSGADSPDEAPAAGPAGVILLPAPTDE